MQMRVIQAVRIPDLGNLLSPLHCLAAMNQDLVQVPVQGIDIPHVSVLTKSVPDNDHVSPSLVTIAGKNNHAVTDRIHRIAQVRVTATDAVPIFTEVSM